MKFKREPLLLGAKQSPPARGRGLKYIMKSDIKEEVFVAPCAGAWVEITCHLLES